METHLDPSQTSFSTVAALPSRPVTVTPSSIAFMLSCNFRVRELTLWVFDFMIVYVCSAFSVLRLETPTTPHLSWLHSDSSENEIERQDVSGQVVEKIWTNGHQQRPFLQYWQQKPPDPRKMHPQKGTANKHNKLKKIQMHQVQSDVSSLSLVYLYISLDQCALRSLQHACQCVFLLCIVVFYVDQSGHCIAKHMNHTIVHRSNRCKPMLDCLTPLENDLQSLSVFWVWWPCRLHSTISPRNSSSGLCTSPPFSTRRSPCGQCPEQQQKAKRYPAKVKCCIYKCKSK